MNGHRHIHGGDQEGLQTAHDSAGLHPVGMFTNPSTEKTSSPSTFQIATADVCDGIETYTAYTAQHHQQLVQGQIPPTVSPSPDPRILGLRRPTFFLSLSNIVLIIGIIIVGVVPSQLNKINNNVTSSTCVSSSGQTSDNSSSTDNSTSSNTNNGNPKICFATTFTAPTALGMPTVECPRPKNETVYKVPNTNLTFLRRCGIDYTGNDMAQVPVVSMADCLAVCAQLNLYPSSALGRCVGVSWVFGNGPQGKGVSYCFPKSKTDTGINPRGDTESAELLTTT